MSDKHYLFLFWRDCFILFQIWQISPRKGKSSQIYSPSSFVALEDFLPKSLLMGRKRHTAVNAELDRTNESAKHKQ